MVKSYNTPGKYKLHPLYEPCYILNGASGQYEIEFPRGFYRIELWGASGASSIGKLFNNAGGKGGYVSGEFSNRARRKFYFHVGTAGKTASTETNTAGSGGYNGGIDGSVDTYNQDCPSGGSGGATDMRIVSGTWDNQEGILNRIAVAGAGGSAGCFKGGGNGGSAGGLNGLKGSNNNDGTVAGGSFGQQTTGCEKGKGCKGNDGNEAGGSGGSGYWGGYGGSSGGSANGGGGGGGGSSYISGYPDCTKLSSFSFESATIIAGNQNMSSPSGTNQYEVGHSGDGVVRITALFYIPLVASCQQFRSANLVLKLMIFCIST